MLIELKVLVYKVAAMKAVMVVPTLAPIINGAACRRLVIFFATRGTTIEVVTVLDRIAAVVTRPQANDLSWSLKKKRLKDSGDRAFIKKDMRRRNTIIDPNSSINANSARIKGLFTVSSKEFVNGAKVHPPEDDGVDAGVDEPNSAVVIQDARPDKKP